MVLSLLLSRGRELSLLVSSTMDSSAMRKASWRCCSESITSGPILLYGTIELPLIAEDFLQQKRVLRVWDPVDPVVRRHNGLRMPFHDSSLELRQKVLPQAALIHLHDGAHAVSLLVVHGKVLESSSQL